MLRVVCATQRHHVSMQARLCALDAVFNYYCLIIIHPLSWTTSITQASLNTLGPDQRFEATPCLYTSLSPEGVTQHTLVRQGELLDSKLACHHVLEGQLARQCASLMVLVT